MTKLTIDFRDVKCYNIYDRVLCYWYAQSLWNFVIGGGLMKSFSYTAKDALGNPQKGTIVAEDERSFLAKIEEKGLTLTSSKENTSSTKKSVHKFSTKELAYNCRQLSAMMSSGLTLVKSLDILCREQDSEAAKNIWRDIYENVQKGDSFSTCLMMQSGAFPPFLISMVAAGEASGSLDVIMKRMQEHYAKENKLNNTIKGAMIYPIVLLVLTVAIVLVMFTFVMPMFIGLFPNEDAMPALTRVLVNISNFLKNRWYICIAVVVVIVLLIIYALKIPSFRLKIDKLLISGPGFGPLIVKIYTGRFARTLSSLYSAGLPMVECLQRSAAILNNSYINQKFETVIDEVKQGESLSASIQRTEIFESMFCSIIYVGEESGALDDILEKSSDYYDEEADSAVARLVQLLEPCMIILLGVCVGLVIAGILPALYSSFENIQ